MPPKLPPLTAAQKEERRLQKNAKMRERYAQQSQEEKEKRKVELKERKSILRQQRTVMENEKILQDEAKRRRLERQEESTQQREIRQVLDAERHRVSREEETLTEAITRKVADRLYQRNRLANETTEEGDLRREANRQQTTSWRNAENDDEAEERCRENRLRMAHLRMQQEETDALHLASEAQHHVDIDPVETPEERNYRERFLIEIRPPNARIRTHKRAQREIENENEIKTHYAGKMDIICRFCGAIHFKGEKSYDKNFALCCSKGKVVLPPPKECPELLYNLLINCHPKSQDFIKDARKYNNALAFASMGAQIKTHQGRGPKVFTIHGQIYHNTSAVEYYNENTSSNPAPKYAQLYFLDSVQANEHRMNLAANRSCDRNLIEQLDSMIRGCNPYAALYKNMKQLALEEQEQALIENRTPMSVGMLIHNDRRTQDERRYNSPAGEEIGVVFSSIDGAPPVNRDIRGHLLIPQRGKGFIQINTQKPMCDPMTYPLLFPNGDNGWDASLKHTSHLTTEDDCNEFNDIDRITEEQQILEDESRTVRSNDNTQVEFTPEPEEDVEFPDPDEIVPIYDVRRRSRITQCEFYSNKLSIRPSIFNPILYCGPLTQQFIVDSYVKVESNRIYYIKTHQNDLHVTQYNGLMDFINNRAERENLTVGTPVILPSSFIGSPRAMKQGYQDAMAICAKHGKPTFFLTFTCNPKWTEITESIESYQVAANRPDVVARVYQLKLKELIKDIQENQILGVVVARIHVIEFQKRGLPHVHMLIWIHPSDVPKTEHDIDQTICAEIPDPKVHPELHKIVMSNMIHGPCGNNNRNSPCMDGATCTKSFPKPFSPTTVINSNGYPTYRRRDTGVTYQLSQNSPKIDNSWVVPYNPFLSLKYNSHINLEFCASITSVKYIFKYIYKGHDCANIETRTGENNGQPTIVWDEISSFLDTRYISAPEACWRLFKYPLCYRSHAVCRLAVHLPQEQPVYFQPGFEESAAAKAASKRTTLTAWFELNASNPVARQYNYRDIPIHFWFDKKQQKWKPRKKRHNVIGRIYSVGVKEIERHSLRLLLIEVKGPTSFEDLRTVDGIIYPSFKAAAIARNLLGDDSAWEKVMEEAAVFQMPVQLRQLFVDICCHCDPTNALILFENNLNHLTEDFINAGHDGDVAKNLALKWIQDKLRVKGRNIEDFQLPLPDFHLINQLINAQIEVNDENERQQKRLRGEMMLAQLNQGQRDAFDDIMKSITDVNSIQPRLYFLDGPGGTGKTFLYNTVINVLEGQGKKVISVASTGIAATLLMDGATYHSKFKIYPPITETTRSKIQETDYEAKLIREASFIICDEATMMCNHALDAIDHLFQKVMKNRLPFGNKVLMLGGDFRQCLPVVKHGNRVKVVEATIKKCATWSLFCQVRLNQNMRTSTGSQEFAEWLINLGNGTLGRPPSLSKNFIEIPTDFLLPRTNTLNENLRSLIHHVFGNPVHLLDQNVSERICSCAILCPKNDDCLKINNQIIEAMPGVEMIYKSIDCVDSEDQEEVANFPTEFLNTLKVAGLPPHELKLKVGAIVILLKNIDSRRGLCNGTRLIIRQLRQNIILADIASGKNKGVCVFIPRMTMTPTDSDLPFSLNRHQFPIMLAFAVTINKAQGQTFDRVGIHLPDPVFSHGQLYVAFSRSTSRDGVQVNWVAGPNQGKMIANYPDNEKVFTQNIVYSEVLL